MAQPEPRTLADPDSPPVPVPVAFLGRTSTLVLQDPAASLRRQLRSAQDWLPPGWFIAAWYWDIESGGLDLEQRGHNDAWRQFTGIDIPRDGGLPDLLEEAKAPTPKFAAVIVEDIERSARDIFTSLRIEKELSGQSIPLFATDEPVDIEGVNENTILVRRVKQGIAEWYRFSLKKKCWKGLVDHSLEGWDIGPTPYGYTADRVRHPVPVKASQGRTKTRLALDPVRAPVVTQIFTWRVIGILGRSPMGPGAHAPHEATRDRRRASAGREDGGAGKIARAAGCWLVSIGRPGRWVTCQGCGETSA